MIGSRHAFMLYPTEFIWTRFAKNHLVNKKEREQKRCASRKKKKKNPDTRATCALEIFFLYYFKHLFFFFTILDVGFLWCSRREGRKGKCGEGEGGRGGARAVQHVGSHSFCIWSYHSIADQCCSTSNGGDIRGITCRALQRDEAKYLQITCPRHFPLLRLPPCRL